MPTTVNEDYRLKLLAEKVSSCNSVLDIACSQLPNKYLNNKKVVGLDLEKGTLSKNYSNFIQGNIDDVIRTGKTFDGVVAGEILEHLYEPISFLKSCSKVLKPGGVLAISTPNPHSIIEVLLTITLNKKYFYTKDHIMLFPQRWLIRIIEISGFDNIQLYSAGFPIPKIGLVPCPRFLCHQTIAVATKAKI